MKPPKIGLIGKQGSGKTTIAKEIVRQLHEERQHSKMVDLASIQIHHSFSEPLKRVLYKIGIKDPKSPIARRVQQYLGTEIMRDYDPEWWIKLLDERTAWSREVIGCVIDDIRFQNEAEWCRKEGFLLVYLLAGDEEVRQAEAINPDHRSEDLSWVIAFNPDIIYFTRTESLTTEEIAADVLKSWDER